MRTQTRVLYELVVIPENVFIVDSSFCDIESVAADIETIAVCAVEVIGNRDQPEMRRHDRVKRVDVAER